MDETLYIIGNGFDMACELPTSYDSFRKYLIDEYCSGANEVSYVYSFKKKGKLAPNDYQNVSVMAHMIDVALLRVYNNESLWCHFEDVLGKLKYVDLMEDKEVGGLNGIVAHAAFTRLKDYFESWIKSIDLSVAKTIRGIKKDAIFLSFNYTLTLEEIYQVQPSNVCHIHGKCNGKEELAFGHKRIEEKYSKNESAAEMQVAIIRSMLEKDTDRCYREHEAFFDRIDLNIKEIVSIGFSYSNVDMYYIKRIIERVGNNTIWYLNAYKIKDALCYAVRIRKCGFKGRIKFFRSVEKYNSSFINRMSI